ncbi:MULTISPECIES: hypothetical protein [Bradyrhizobium]|uniref:hypothetical protein n=1 Tax=Bradyrhizobium TaxID=374 RepID=UPI001BA476A7|nr:hypothetical protein [Bradyrhizobium liaoningense]MBR0987910.1 hypothetical protein [Bradyrhizobium liaoningense]GMO96603.1 hypothetical protein TM239_12580 [Bradyrhizobium sp. TM239]
MIEVRIVEPGIVVQPAIGTLEAAEEIIEARMRAAGDPAPALRLALHECDLHGAQPRRRRWMTRAEAAAFTGRAT